MKILTWNINGIRSVRRELQAIFETFTYDVICVQETKVTRDQLDERSAVVDGYNSYFSFSRGRSGYSGVATFVQDKCTPEKAEEGLSGIHAPDDCSAIGCHGDLSSFSSEELELLDNEGRCIITQHQIMDTEGQKHLLTIVNVYCPRADPENDDRKIFKIRFYELLQTRVEALLHSNSYVIVLGDINTSHTKLDHCDPVEDKEFNANPGRKWLNQFLESCKSTISPSLDLSTGLNNDQKLSTSLNNDQKLSTGLNNDQKLSTGLNNDQKLSTGLNNDQKGGHFVDVFRKFHADRENAFTCWSTMTGSRATNYGTRIDYIFADCVLYYKAFSGCDILPEVIGSDHCPVHATLHWEIIGNKKFPEMCTKFMPEFSGKQQKLSAFFKKNTKNEFKDEDLFNLKASNDLSVSVNVSVPMKRHADELLQSDKNKKVKSFSDNMRKQGNLLNFFGRKTSERSISNNAAFSLRKQDEDILLVTEVLDSASMVKSESLTIIQAPEVVSHFVPVERAAAASWKSLLRGPEPPPLCKGHNEPCLLRTVKKDTLNKGRQFWVCPRPEGHKNNPEARCDHFVWIVKKKS